MDYFLFFVGWIIGIFITSFTLIPILIIIFFGFPVTKKLNNHGLLKKGNKIIRNYLFSLLILSTILLITLYILYSFFIGMVFAGFVWGGIMVIIFGAGKIGKNPNNITDYLQVNRNQFTADMEEITSAIYQDTTFLLANFKKIYLLIIIGAIVVYGYFSIINNKKNVLPDKFIADKEAFGVSLSKFGETSDITNRPDANASGEEVKKVLSLTLESINSSNKVSDEFLDYLHPNLKINYREKFVRSQQLYYDGLSQTKDDDTRDSESVKNQIEAGKLMNEWLIWWKSNSGSIISKAFPES